MHVSSNIRKILVLYIYTFITISIYIYNNNNNKCSLYTHFTYTFHNIKEILILLTYT